MSDRTQKVVGAALLAGVLGWVVEAVWTGAPRFSLVFGDRKIPFLPVYAVGGGLVAILAPALAPFPLLLRLGGYAGIMAVVEQVAWKLSHATAGKATWGYSNGEGTDVPHASAWGLMSVAFAAGVKDAVSFPTRMSA